MIRALIVSALLAAGMSAAADNAAAQSQQDTDQASAAHSASGSGAASKPKPKKVWTNDDMSDVTGTISVVGTPQQQKPPNAPSKISSLVPAVPSSGNPKQAAATKSGDDSVDPKILAQLRQQLQKLQASIDQVDKQIEQLKGASRGDSKNLGILTSDSFGGLRALLTPSRERRSHPRRRLRRRKLRNNPCRLPGLDNRLRLLARPLRRREQ